MRRISVTTQSVDAYAVPQGFFEVDVNKSDVPTEQDINNDTASTYRQGLMYNGRIMNQILGFWIICIRRDMMKMISPYARRIAVHLSPPQTTEG